MDNKVFVVTFAFDSPISFVGVHKTKDGAIESAMECAYDIDVKVYGVEPDKLKEWLMKNEYFRHDEGEFEIAIEEHLLGK